MTWIKLDDGFTRHPRMVAAGLHGRALFIAGLCYCGTHLTDGWIPKAAFPMLCAEAGVPARTWKKLLEVGSWVDHGGERVEVHDFLVYNPSRDEVMAGREVGRRRWALNNDPELRRMIRERDGDDCRYCGRRVDWRDRKSPKGGTYDHVTPVSKGGGDGLDNLVVCCRDCNGRKGVKTPEGAGMVLRDCRPDIKHESSPESRHTSRPVPSPNSSSNTSSSPIIDDEVEKVLEAFADLQRQRNRRVTNVTGWRNAVISNARREHDEQIRRWLNAFNLPAKTLAAGLIDGPRGDWDHHRRIPA